MSNQVQVAITSASIPTTVEISVPGPQGIQGPPGPAGAAAAWLQGSGAPATELGSDGDFYLNTANGDVFGPKAAGAWGSAIFSIAEGQQGPAGATGPAGPQGGAGPQGAAGVDGRTLLNGTSAPSNGVGADGDFFINTAASIIYGPKTAGVWPAGVSLIGATGAQGPAGVAGADGAPGADGADAYEVAVAEGFSGTKSQWLASLVGPQGPQGETGPAGADGADGADGATGPQGPAGPQGAGLALQGNVPTVGDLPGSSTVGYGYIVEATGDLYVWNGSSWVNAGPIQGPQGPAGATGPQGPAGPAGADGAQGPAGPEGPQGATGSPGAQGPQGEQGPQGPAGADGASGAAGSSAYQVAVAGGFIGTESQWLASLVGPQGPAGADGAQGTAGPQGPEGPQGATGAQGPQGEQGPAGPAGADGADGAAGAPGADGADGRTILNGSGAPSSGTGSDGDFFIDIAADAIYGPKTAGTWGSPTSLIGPLGPAGADGADGAAGATGPQGPQGPAGPQGDAGPAGATGPQGPAGATGATGPQGPAGVVTATAPITYDAGTQTVAITAATSSAAGSMSSADKTKLDGIEAGAQVNPGTVTTSAAGLQPASGYGTLSYAAQVTLDFAASDKTMNTISLTGALELLSSNLANGREVRLRLVCDATQRTLTFPTDWKFVGTKPANIAASKVAILSLAAFGTTNADVVAAYAFQS